MLLEIPTTNVVAKLETDTPKYEAGVLALGEWLRDEWNVRGITLGSPQRLQKQKDFIAQVTQESNPRSLRFMMGLAARCHIPFPVAVEILRELNKGKRGWFLEAEQVSSYANDTSVVLFFKRIPEPEKHTPQWEIQDEVAQPVESTVENTPAYSRHSNIQIQSRSRVDEWKPSKESVVEWSRLKAIMTAYENDRFMVALGGDPSIGKTWLAQHWALGGRTCYNVTMNEDSYAGELKGYVVKDKDGNFIWFNGPATRAFKDGDRIVVNEIQRSPANCLSYLLELTESFDSAMISLPPPSNETLRQHPKLQVIASYNGDFEDMPEALKSRFTTRIHLKSANPDAIMGLPNYLRKIASISVVCDDLMKRVSLRHWYDYVDKLKKGIDEDTAAWSVFGDQADEVLNQIKLSR